MKPEIKERVYLLIIIFCMFMCTAMVLTMITGGVKNGDETHVPVSRPIISDVDTTDKNGEAVQNQDANQQDASLSPDDKSQGDVLNPNGDGIIQTEGQIAITEDFINEQWGRFLPSDFPLKNPELRISADGIITVSGRVSKDELRAYLKDIGVKLGLRYSLALLLLPGNFDIEASLSVSEGSDGQLVIAPYSLYLSGKKIPISIFPRQITEILSNAVNGVISSIGGVFRFSGFEDGALLFQLA